MTLILRRLRRSPLFTLAAVAIVAIGVGAAVSVYAVMDAVLRRPLPAVSPDRVVVVRDQDARGTDVPLTWDDFKALRAATRTMSAVAGEAHQGASPMAELRDGRPLVLDAAWVTGNFFDVLGTRPALGRFFHADDESTFEPSVLVISYDTWKRQFAGDSAVLGTTLTDPYTNRQLTIIGVAPAGLDYPSGAQYWTPLVYSGGLDVVGRLAPGTRAEAARAEFQAISTALRRQHGLESVLHVQSSTIRSLPDAVSGQVRPALLVLTGAVSLLLLLVSINVGALLLMRAMERSHEVAVRRALGAGPVAVVMPGVLEALAVSAAGAVIGYLMAGATLRAVWLARPQGIPRIDLLHAGGASLVVTAAVAIVTAVLVALAPTVVILRSDLMAVLRGGRRGGSPSGRRRMQQSVVAAQVALAVMLVTGAGLLGRTFEQLHHIDLGYSPQHLSFLRIATVVTPDDADQRFARLLAAVPPAFEAVPGVQAVTPLDVEPFYGPGVFNGPWEVEGAPIAAGDAYPRLPIEVGGDDYFRTLGIPVLQGRGFVATDTRTSPGVAVVSAEAARVLGLGAHPVGRRIRTAGDTGAASWRTVVGVAGDIHYRDLRTATPSVFLPASQFFFQGLVAVRSSGSLAALLPRLRQALHQADPAAVIAQSQTMESMLATQTAVPRLSLLLLSGFAAVALLLVGIGLFGLMAAVVQAQRREIGIRLALGATPGRVRGEVLRRALEVTVAGAAMGVLLALVGSRLLRSLLYQVSPRDPAAMGAAVVTLLAVAALSAWWPAWRATTVDPVTVLGSE